MPRVYHVKKARKKNPVADVGEPYFWWKHAFGAKQFSKTIPRRSQLTQSGFLSELYELQDGLGNRFKDIDSIADDVQEFIDELSGLLDQCTESLENMPEHLQEASSSGELLQERIDGLENWINAAESIDTDYEEDLSDEDKEERFNEIIQEVCDTDCEF